jgi:hypothetical protein
MLREHRHRIALQGPQQHDARLRCLVAIYHIARQAKVRRDKRRRHQQSLCKQQIFGLLIVPVASASHIGIAIFDEYPP